MKIFIFIIISSLAWAQISLVPKEPLKKNDFFIPNSNQKQGEKVQVINADFTKKNPEKYGGNTYFEGNVEFQHQGSTLKADLVIFYEDENFLKAIGNTKLVNTDGSIITADEMEYDGNTQKGIAKKNVVLTDPKQTIRTNQLFYDRVSNKAYFNSGGTITDGHSTMYSKSATYEISTQMIDFTGNVKIENNQYTINGANIVQNQNTNTANFFGPTTITSKKNPKNRVYTELGSYNMNSKEVFLNKNSTIFYNDKTLKGDKMYMNQSTGFGKANGNVVLNDPKERRYIKGGYGEIYVKKDSAMVTDKPMAVKILEKDSVYFGAEKFLTWQKPDLQNLKKSYLRAYKHARLYKTNIQARADSMSFNETDGILYLHGKPMAWSGGKQVSGEKIVAYFNTENEKLDSLNIFENSFAISKVDSLNLLDEFHQVKGKIMSVYFQNNEIHQAKVIGNAQAITYADEEDTRTKKIERIGVTLSICGIIEALFEEKKIQIVSCNIAANTETYPMSLITDEQRFLQGFNWNTKDRLRKWQDIFLISPNYEDVKYISDNPYYKATKEKEEKQKAAEEAKKPKRIRK